MSQARVEVGGESVAEIGPGLLVLLGVAVGDSVAEARALAHKIAHLRIFEDDAGRMNRSLVETGGSLVVVSQFTLLADCSRGRRPFFGAAAPPEQAAPLVEALIAEARALGLPVESGRFQAVMEVTLTNRGPVTICLDTEKAS